MFATANDRVRLSRHRSRGPYMFTCAILLVYSICIMVYRNSISWDIFLAVLFPASRHMNLPTLVIWFLMALFFARLLLLVIWKLDIKQFYKWIIVFNISIFAIIIGQHYDVPFGFLQGCSAIIFVAFGKVLYNLNKVHTISYALLFVGGLLWFLSIKFCKVDMAQLSYSLYPIALLGSIGATYVLFCISKVLGGRSFFSKGLIWLGKNSLVIMCAHSIEKYIPIWSLLNIDNFFLLLLSKMLFCILFVLFMRRIKIGRVVFQYS